MTSFTHLTLILLLHYLVKCRSRILDASAQKISEMSRSMGVRTIATSYWDRCYFLTFAQHLAASFSAGQCPITSRQRHSSVDGSRDDRFYPTCCLAA